VASADIERIHAFASRFRSAIEACDRTCLGEGMRAFPRGACGDTTDLLGTYLLENGCGTFDYVLGYRPREPDDESGIRASHAWLQRGELVVDITADQFPEIDSPVIVAEPSEWHQSFEDQEVRHNADFRIHGAFGGDLNSTYRQICAVLERSV
jgi:hypothetical protein